ncbi:MAG: hypothetical protein HFJ69_07475, partial [Enterorhabdus sp.]|nr:hypothetical protein [Enterorhabdus sp.]
LGIAYKRARYFITMNGAYGGSGIDFSRDALHARLSAPIEGGRHGRRADRAVQGQMSLFEAADVPPVLPEASPANRAALDVAFEAQRRALAPAAPTRAMADGAGGERRTALDAEAPRTRDESPLHENAPHDDDAREPLLSVA